VMGCFRGTCDPSTEVWDSGESGGVT
jgi:hypothetical protein